MPKSRAELEKTKMLSKNGFSRAIQPTSRRPVLKFPETREEIVLTTTSGSRVSKPPGRGKPTEIKFSDDDIKESAVTHGPSILEVIDSIRSPSPDFGSDDMDDLIRAAPDSALDANNFDTALDLVVDDVEEASSPSDGPRASRKRLYDSHPGPDQSSKRARNDDWEGEIGRHRFRPVRSDSVQEVSALQMETVLESLLIWSFYEGYRLSLQTGFFSSVSSWEQ